MRPRCVGDRLLLIVDSEFQIDTDLQNKFTRFELFPNRGRYP